MVSLLGEWGMVGLCRGHSVRWLGGGGPNMGGPTSQCDIIPFGDGILWGPLAQKIMEVVIGG